ncbi:MAG TPA: hypothetical protein VHE34_06630 [Puia sp.]|uniref:hypothetical protein n=1 Tax=Puia sp. TaxID=2045100 RepID=UPI002D0588A4|nr:hypothetical protein [Puia sp.]HVU94881.1 hypothetical protein [Puia sp.]
MAEELLKVLIDKVVDNGKAIHETQDQIRQLPGQEELTAGWGQRMDKLEEQVGSMDKGLTVQVSEVQKEVGKMRRDVAGLWEQVGTPASGLVIGLAEMRRQMREFTEFFNQPKRKEVHYRHHLGRAFWVLIAVVLIAVSEAGALVYSAHREADYEEHDWVWRAARLSEDSVVTKVLDTLQRNWQRDADGFRKDVVAEEERRVELMERVIQERETNNRIRELQGQKKKVGFRGGGN